jgi:hypothetical protein
MVRRRVSEMGAALGITLAHRHLAGGLQQAGQTDVEPARVEVL